MHRRRGVWRRMTVVRETIAGSPRIDEKAATGGKATARMTIVARATGVRTIAASPSLRNSPKAGGPSVQAK